MESNKVSVIKQPLSTDLKEMSWPCGCLGKGHSRSADTRACRRAMGCSRTSRKQCSKEWARRQVVGGDGEKGESSVDYSPTRAKYEDADYSECDGKPGEVLSKDTTWTAMQLKGRYWLLCRQLNCKGQEWQWGRQSREMTAVGSGAAAADAEGSRVWTHFEGWIWSVWEKELEGDYDTFGPSDY